MISNMILILTNYYYCNNYLLTKIKPIIFSWSFFLCFLSCLAASLSSHTRKSKIFPLIPITNQSSLQYLCSLHCRFSALVSDLDSISSESLGELLVCLSLCQLLSLPVPQLLTADCHFKIETSSHHSFTHKPLQLLVVYRLRASPFSVTFEVLHASPHQTTSCCFIYSLFFG